MKALLALACFAFPSFGFDDLIQGPAKPVSVPQVEEAFQQLYSSHFEAAEAEMDRFIAAHPENPLGYAVKGVGYEFSELDRLGILEGEFFENDKAIADKRKLKPDPKIHDGFYATTGKAISLAEAILAKNSDDRNALFSISLALGEQSDYMALVEKRQLASLSVDKRAYRYANHLLKIDPSYYDAYVTTGFTEYLIGNLPTVVRWFVKFDDVEGSKEKGLDNLKLVAQKGHYLKGMAKILLAAAYLREKKPEETQKLLQDLGREYPDNQLIRRELAKVSSRVKGG